MRRFTSMCAAAVLVAACADSGGYRPQTYRVQPQDTLYSIAWRNDLDFEDLAAWNDLGPDFKIQPGQILTLQPRHGTNASPVQTGSRPRPVASARDVPKLSKAKPLPDLMPPVDTVIATPAEIHAVRWSWPTKVLGTPTVVAGGGLMIPGGLGQDVLAAAAGKVVYVGSGLLGYGNLVIIKHSETLLSAYAHSRELSVQEGEWVAAGERIGAMGLGPRQIPALYFEIRYKGKPTPVLPYLNAK